MYRVMLEIVTLELLTLYMMNYDYMTFICFIVCAYIIISFYVSFRLKHFMHCNLDVLILSICPNRRVREGRVRTGNIKSISLMVACLQGPDGGQKCVKISKIFNFGVQL